jgi:hypothetical protein
MHQISTLTNSLGTTPVSVGFVNPLVTATGIQSIATAGYVTVALAGAWHIHVQVQVGSSVANTCHMFLRKSTSVTLADTLENSGVSVSITASPSLTVLSRTWVVNLAALDVVSVWLHCASTGASLRSTTITGAGVSPSVRIMMHLASTSAPHSQIVSSGPAS